MTVERYSHIMHLTSQVSGRAVAEGKGPIDVLRATLPAGHALGRAQGAGHGDHRRARADQAGHLRRAWSATSTSRATSTRPSPSAPWSSPRTGGRRSRPGRASWPTATRRARTPSARTRRPPCWRRVAARPRPRMADRTASAWPGGPGSRAVTDDHRVTTLRADYRGAAGRAPGSVATARPRRAVRWRDPTPSATCRASAARTWRRWPSGAGRLAPARPRRQARRPGPGGPDRATTAFLLDVDAGFGEAVAARLAAVQAAFQAGHRRR